MVRKNDLVVEKIGQVVDSFNVSDTTKYALFDELMYQGTKPLGLVWARGKSTAQIGTECSETHQMAISICSSVMDIARHHATFVNKRNRLRSSIKNVLESHVTCTLPFELGDDASDFVDELTKRCAQFAGDQVVKNIADLLVDLESLNVLPRCDNSCNSSEHGTSDSEDNSDSQLSKLSDEDSGMESESESGENDEEHEESEASICTDGEDEGNEPKTQIQTHNTASEKSKLPIRKRVAAYRDSESSEDDIDEAMISPVSNAYLGCVIYSAIRNALMAEEAQALWNQKRDMLPDEEYVRCTNMFVKYIERVQFTALAVWRAVQSKTQPTGVTSSVSYLRTIERVQDASFREDLLQNLLMHVSSVDPIEDNLFIEVLKLNNTTSMHIWAVLWKAASSAEFHVVELNALEAIQAHIMLFDLSRHGLYFEVMDRITTDEVQWTPSSSEQFEEDTLMYIWNDVLFNFMPKPIDGILESDRAESVAMYLQDIVSRVNGQSRYYGGQFLLPLCARLAFGKFIRLDTDPTASQLTMISDFLLRMVRIPISVVFETKIFNMHEVVGSLCNSQRTSMERSTNTINENLRDAVERKDTTMSKVQAEYSYQSACAVPIMTYDRVCDKMWLCCILTFVPDNNSQQSSASGTPTLVQSLKTVPEQYQSWDGLFKAFLGKVFSTSVSEKVVDAVYNTDADEYVLYVSIEQFVRGNEIKTLDRDLAMRNTRATADVSSDYEPFFGQLGLVCIKERWAVSAKPLKPFGYKLLFPTLTLGRLLELARDQSDCFDDKFNEEMRLLELLQNSIETECSLVNDPVSTNLFNIKSMFAESEFGAPISVMADGGYLLTESTAVESIVYDIAVDAEKDELSLFTKPRLENLSSGFSTTAKTRVQNNVNLYLERWKHPFLQSDPTQYEWNLRLNKYRDPGRYKSLCYNNALLEMVKLHNTNQIVNTQSPFKSNSILATCIGEIRKFSAGVKAALSILKPLRDMLVHQNVVQSRSTRIGKTGISDVASLKYNVSRLVDIVEQVDVSVSKQHLRVCDACESFHGRIESSIPTLSLIDRINRTLKSVKALLSDPSVSGVLSSISTVCKGLLSSGNMNMYSSKLKQAHNWTPKFENNQSAFASDDIYTVHRSDDVVKSVTEWERVYSDVYKPHVVRALLHMILSEDNVVSVPLERPDRHVLVDEARIDNIVSADEREAAEEQEKLAYEQRVEAQNRLYRKIVDIDSATTERLETERMFVKKKQQLLNLMDTMYKIVESHQRQPRKNRFIDRGDYDDLLTNGMPAQGSRIITRIEWIVRCDNFVMGVLIPNKDGTKFPAVGIRKDWKRQYDTFKQVYRQLITVLCDVVARQLDIYAHLFPESVIDPMLPRQQLDAVFIQMFAIGNNPELDDNMVVVMSNSHRVIEAYLTGSDDTNETSPSRAIRNALASIPNEDFDGKQVWTENEASWSLLADQIEWLALMKTYAVDEVNDIVGDANFFQFETTLGSLYEVMLTLISTWSNKILKVRELESSLRS